MILSFICAASLSISMLFNFTFNSASSSKLDFLSAACKENITSEIGANRIFIHSVIFTHITIVVLKMYHWMILLPFVYNIRCIFCYVEKRKKRREEEKGRSKVNKGCFLLESPLDRMLVHRRVTSQHQICRYPFIHLGGERHCESKVSCPRTQLSVPGQGSNPDHSIPRRARKLWGHRANMGGGEYFRNFKV